MLLPRALDPGSGDLLDVCERGSGRGSESSSAVIGLLTRVSGVAALALALSGCANVGAPPAAPTQVASPTADVGQAVLVAPGRPTTVPVRCDAGRLTVGDIPAIDAEWRDGLAAAEERAIAWRPDARLVELRVACAPLEAGFRWQGTFYSDSAQSFFQTDTGQTRPAEVDPATVVTLPRERITFIELHRALARAGYGDGTLLGATSGITVRSNLPSEPFGPPQMPQDLVFHVVADDGRGENDLFVSVADWLVRTYAGETGDG